MCILRILKNRVILGILESGRLISLMIPREERVCNCDTDIQTLAHYMLNIPVLTGLKDKFGYRCIREALTSPNAAKI